MSRKYDKEIADAHKNELSRDDMEFIYGNDTSARQECDEEIARIDTRYLLEIADKLGVSAPMNISFGNAPSKDWFYSETYDRNLLTNQGRARLRTAIRQEKRERRDGCLPYISAVTGLLGVVVAVLALVYRH